MTDQEYMYITEEIAEIIHTDEDYQYWLERVGELETDYSNLRETLTQTQRDLLDDYIGACEAMDNCRMWIAYELGRKHATILIP